MKPVNAEIKCNNCGYKKDFTDFLVAVKEVINCDAVCPKCNQSRLIAKNLKALEENENGKN